MPLSKATFSSGNVFWVVPPLASVVEPPDSSSPPPHAARANVRAANRANTPAKRLPILNCIRTPIPCERAASGAHGGLDPNRRKSSQTVVADGLIAKHV